MWILFFINKKRTFAEQIKFALKNNHLIKLYL